MDSRGGNGFVYSSIIKTKENGSQFCDCASTSLKVEVILNCKLESYQTVCGNNWQHHMLLHDLVKVLNWNQASAK